LKSIVWLKLRANTNAYTPLGTMNQEEPYRTRIEEGCEDSRPYKHEGETNVLHGQPSDYVLKVNYLPPSATSRELRTRIEGSCLS